MDDDDDFIFISSGPGGSDGPSGARLLIALFCVSMLVLVLYWTIG